MPDGAVSRTASLESCLDPQPFDWDPPAVSNVIFRRHEPNGRRLA
jgi:hypothetical protein